MQIPPFFFHYANMASGHMSEHTLLNEGDIIGFFVMHMSCSLNLIMQWHWTLMVEVANHILSSFTEL